MRGGEGGMGGRGVGGRHVRGSGEGRMWEVCLGRREIGRGEVCRKKGRYACQREGTVLKACNYTTAPSS